MTATITHRFGVLDDLGFAQRTGLLILCAMTCCWGFTNNTILLIFASKVGFPMAVAVCSVVNSWKRLIHLLYYTLLLCGAGFLFFQYQADIVVEAGMVNNYNPARMDFYLATGLGCALSIFWHHPIRINLVMASAGLASLLPACIMAGYCLARGKYDSAVSSGLLYVEYLSGLYLGALSHHFVEWVYLKYRKYRSRYGSS